MGRERRTYSPELPVRFKDVLLPDAQNFYDWVVPQGLQFQYESELHKVKRMQGLRAKGFLPEGYQESNQEHVVDAMKMAREYNDKYPNLSAALKAYGSGGLSGFSGVQIQLGEHDCGEIPKVIGDVQPTNRTPQDERRKRFEPFAARKIVLSRVPNPQAREIALEHYNRYQANNSQDLITQMARFIDKAQGTTRVAEIAFNANRVADEEIRNKMRLHLWQTVPRMMEPAMNLMVNLPTRASREDLRTIVLEELRMLEKSAPSEVARAFMKGLAA